MKKVGIVMGSKSDLPVIEKTIEVLKEFEVPFEVHVYSAHRCPENAKEFASSAKEKGFGVLIGAAGMAAHLAGALAANSTLPVIGLPLSATLNGVDSLLSTLMMPPGVPVACVGVDGGKNAGLLAIQMLAIEDKKLSLKLMEAKKKNLEKVLKDDKEVTEKYGY